MAYPRVVVKSDPHRPGNVGREGSLLYIHETHGYQWGMVKLDGDGDPLVYDMGALAAAPPPRRPLKRTVHAWARVTHAEAMVLARDLGLVQPARERFTTRNGGRQFKVGLEVDQDTGESVVVSVDGLEVERRD